MKRLIIITAAWCMLQACSDKPASTSNSTQEGTTTQLSKATLQDKIRGGWAGQTIGVSYGGPMEFRFQGSMIQDYQPIPWPEHYIKHWFDNSPGLFDDIYMDLTFVDVLEKYGMDAPIDSFAKAYALAPYPLWHANQSGRYNILQGMSAPQSGHWLNNPHADCIDFQIESDFAGLMNPGMPQAAAVVCDKVGHIMNYGDGWYGGVYVATMYSLAFIKTDIKEVVKEALKSIPAESNFYKCMNDVIAWYEKNPGDWKSTWFEIQKKWTNDTGCPDGVFSAFNIDATVNAAYVITGLLYGNGDFDKTMDITTRCGQDADCNPSTAAGILGTLMGYTKIPERWKKDLEEVESITFPFTKLSLNDVYATSMRHALMQITRYGGTVTDSLITLHTAPVQPVKREQSFPGLQPTVRKGIGKTLTDTLSAEFEGDGVVLTGALTKEWDTFTPWVYHIQVTLDGKADTVNMPYNFRTRRNEIYWNYQLPAGKHRLQLRLLNPNPISTIRVNDLIQYKRTTAP
ncbi:MAG: ADP-ribosylglycohydrolase family protein [Bacteroidetes bacterium]|nr:ADP-ribosylglycohydrolase family protein [Bacteroidota bacterium]